MPLLFQRNLLATQYCNIGRIWTTTGTVGKGPLPYLYQPCSIGAAWRPFDDSFIVTYNSSSITYDILFGQAELLCIKQLADLHLWLRLSCPSPSQAPVNIKLIQCPDPEGCFWFKTVKTFYLLLLSLNLPNHNFHADEIFNSLGDLK